MSGERVFALRSTVTMTQPIPCRLSVVPSVRFTPEVPPKELKNTLAGVVDALSHLPQWQGVLATSELDQRIVFQREPPFSLSGSPSSRELVGKPVRDRDIDRIRHWFEDVMGCALSKQHVIDAARIVADDHAFHPVRDYLSGLTWDGKPRVDRWLEDYGAVVPASEPHAELIRSVARRWLVACVARAMKPGSKVDTMLILEGRQGIGKSTAFATLAGVGLHCDSAIDFGSKEACQTLQGVWIFELPELDALLRHETSVIKAFLSRSVDRFRVPYGRAPENVPRSVVFCGTVNHGGYLRDRTGNRRFWVVRCEDTLNVDGLGAARDALWAEAVHLYRSGEPWHLSLEHETLMHGEHEGRLECDPWDETLEAWTSARGEHPFTMNELLESALGLRSSGKNPRVTARVSQLLSALGFERRKRSALPRTYYYARAPLPSPSGVPASPRPTPFENLEA
jgi:putative DNA primase/helicase